MRLLFLLLLISTSFSAQSSNDIQNLIKLKTYSSLDSINVYSKDYPTKLIEGSGFIMKNKNVGSIGYSTKITKDKNDKIVSILKSESNHYEKSSGKPQKSNIIEIIIYFDEYQQPDLAKYISKTYTSDSLVTSTIKLFNLKQNNEDNPEFKNVKMLLDETKKHLK
jgi:hypothetical protein